MLYYVLRSMCTYIYNMHMKRKPTPKSLVVLVFLTFWVGTIKIRPWARFQFFFLLTSSRTQTKAREGKYRLAHHRPHHMGNEMAPEISQVPIADIRYDLRKYALYLYSVLHIPSLPCLIVLIHFPKFNHV